MTTAERSRAEHPVGQNPKRAKAGSVPTGRTVWDEIPQSLRRHAALQPEDTAERTFGCRASNPDACGKHGMRLVCAFVREDGLCLAPPRSWAKQYPKLLAGVDDG